MIRSQLLSLPFAALLVAACGGAAPVPETGGTKTGQTPPAPSLAAVGPLDGIACIGPIDAPPASVKEVADDTLAKSAIDETGKGKLCTARVYEAEAPVKVYRVWNSQKTYTELGRWWSLTKPAGPVDIYREENAICPEWNELDRLSVCELKVGARFVMGPGQSAKCENNKEYAKSAVNQVFIPNDTRENKVFVEHCEQLGAWP